VDVRVGLKQCCGIDVLEDRAIAWTQPRQGIAQEIFLPVADRADAVDQHETPNGTLIAFSG
jgi:hypothetical protein